MFRWSVFEDAALVVVTSHSAITGDDADTESRRATADLEGAIEACDRVSQGDSQDNPVGRALFAGAAVADAHLPRASLPLGVARRRTCEAGRPGSSS